MLRIWWKLNDNDVGVRVMNSTVQRRDESDLAYEYFKLYRDTDRDKRSLRALCGRDVDGKKRSLNVIGRWSVRHEWSKRVQDWDIDRSRDQLRVVITQRNKELSDFIDKDFQIATSAQRLVQDKLDRMGESDDFNCSEFRQIMIGYREAREFLKDLIGVFEANLNGSRLS